MGEQLSVSGLVCCGLFAALCLLLSALVCMLLAQFAVVWLVERPLHVVDAPCERFLADFLLFWFVVFLFPLFILFLKSFV